MNDQSSIINFWRASELFEPQQIRDTDGSLIKVKSDDSLPWLKPNKKFDERCFYQVYCGIFKIKKLKTVFEEIFSDSDSDLAERVSGETAAFTFIVDNCGSPIADTFILSSCAWGLGNTLKVGRQSRKWLQGFESDSAKFAEDFFERMKNLADDQEISGDKKRVILNYRILDREVRFILRELGIKDEIEATEIAVKRFQKTSQKTDAENADFLNSFYLQDLSKVSKEITRGNFGAGLNEYLTLDKDVSGISKIDTRNSIETLFSNLSPGLFPSGRWAVKDLHYLSFSQQFAINSAFQKLQRTDGLFAVNGPPGTGKTTNLRDVIAAIVVERAKILAEYKYPERAFYGKTIQWESGDFKHYIAPLDEKLKNFGIVVVSSNNGAVENVTKELPVVDAIDKSWKNRCEYFSEAAYAMLDAESWGMIAACLGNSKNRQNFISNFWFDNRKAGDNFVDDKKIKFKSILDRIIENNESFDEDWKAVVEDFKAASQAENRIREKKNRLYQTIIEKQKILNSLKQLNNERNRLGELIELNDEKLFSLESEKQILESRQENWIRQKEINNKTHLSLASIISSWGRSLWDWKREDAELRKNLAELTNEFSLLQTRREKFIEKKTEYQAEIRNIERQVKTHTARVNKISEFLETERENHKIPDLEKWFAKDAKSEAERELSSPWMDDDWNLARMNVFAKALQIHKVFIQINAKSIRKNLSAFVDILQGKIGADFKSHQYIEGASDVWSTFFLVTPVVSTTFASFDKMFKHLGREEIGWLLIDEAGQAAPQAAVGGIWRSRRTIIVGDPLQLEPISVLPDKMQKILANRFEVSETWIPGRTSVQELADRVSELGTELIVEDSPIWVGSPLRVHRRCLEPMFSISNKIAYDGLMIYGTKDDIKPDIPESAWIHVESSEFDGHWSEQEGNKTELLIKELFSSQRSAKDIFCISPFAQVAGKLNSIARKYNLKGAGTIHTTQGKEADVVILVLGGNPEKPGAKAWAASKPNLLNVAVSRAKKRLYVIGNRKLWSNQPYFNVLSDKLP